MHFHEVNEIESRMRRALNLECEGSRANHTALSAGLVKVVRMTGTESFHRSGGYTFRFGEMYGFAKNALAQRILAAAKFRAVRSLVLIIIFNLEPQGRKNV